ncbi:MAG: hypothetical protein ACRC33_09905, partial [Gemmataceae bacterium]
MSDEPRRRWRWGRWLGAVAAVAALLAVTAYLAGEYRVRSALAAALAEVSEADPDWRIHDLLRSRPPLLDQENSVPRILAVARAVPPKWPDPAASTRLDRLAANRRPDAEQAAALEQLLAGTPLAAARDLIRYPRGRFDLLVPEDPLAMRLPDHQKARDVALLLSYDALRRTLGGDADGALLSVRAGLNVSRSMLDDPTLVGHLTRHAALRTALAAAERVLAVGAPSDPALADLSRDLEREAQGSPITLALRAERANTFNILRLVIAGGNSDSLFTYDGPSRLWTAYQMRESARREQPGTLRLMTKIVEASELPDAEQLDAGARIDREVRDTAGELGKMLIPSFAKVTGADRRSRCAAAAMRGLIAAELHRREHGVWPDAVP